MKNKFYFFFFAMLMATGMAWSEDAPRRALPAPFPSPPFPSGEYQGYPLIGVPSSDAIYPLMKAVYKTSCGDAIKKLEFNFTVG